MRPVFRKDEDLIDKIVEKKVGEALKKQESTNKDKTVQGTTSEGTQKSATKMVEILDNIRKGKEENKGSGEYKGHVHNMRHEDMVSCPACHGHMKGVGDGMTYKCSGPDCKEEMIIIPKNADYKCTSCNAPIKKPEENSGHSMKDTGCPFCGNKKAIRYDWSGLQKVTKK